MKILEYTPIKDDDGTVDFKIKIELSPVDMAILTEGKPLFDCWNNFQSSIEITKEKSNDA